MILSMTVEMEGFKGPWKIILEKFLRVSIFKDSFLVPCLDTAHYGVCERLYIGFYINLAMSKGKDIQKSPFCFDRIKTSYMLPYRRVGKSGPCTLLFNIRL